MQQHEHLVLRAQFWIEYALDSPTSQMSGDFRSTKASTGFFGLNAMEYAHEFCHDPICHGLNGFSVHMVGVNVASAAGYQRQKKNG